MAQNKIQFPWQLFKTAWKEGVTNAFVPKSFGGSGYGLHDTHHVAHQIRSTRPLLKPIIGAHFKAQMALNLAASSKQQEAYFHLMAKYPIVAGAFTPGVTSNHCFATYRTAGNNYILNGSGLKYNNADVASFYLVEAKPEDDPLSSSTSLFVLDKHRLGINIEPLDLSSIEGDGHCRNVSFHNVMLTPGSLLGELDQGHHVTSMTSAVMEEVLQ